MRRVDIYWMRTKRTANAFPSFFARIKYGAVETRRFAMVGKVDDPNISNARASPVVREQGEDDRFVLLLV